MPADEMSLKTATKHLASKSKAFNQALHSLDSALKGYHTLFDADEVLISHPSDKAKPIFGSLLSNQAINDKEQFFDAMLIALKTKCDSLIDQRVKLSNSVDKKLRTTKKQILSNIQDSSKAIALDISRLSKLNTTLTETLSALNDRCQIIQDQITVFSQLRDKFKIKAKNLSTELSQLKYDPDFCHDETTKESISRLSSHVDEISKIEATLKTSLKEQVSREGRKHYQNAAHRYEAAGTLYQHLYGKLAILSDEIKKTTHHISERQGALDSKASQYHEHLDSLIARAQLTPLKLTADDLSMPPYDAFDNISDNLSKLPACLIMLEEAAQSRQSTLSHINKKSNWIDITLQQEESHYQSLKNLEPKIQAIYASIEETILTIQSYTSETQSLLSAKLKLGLNTLSQCQAPLDTLNHSVKDIGLCPEALNRAQRSVDDATLNQQTLKDFTRELQSLNANILFTERDALIKRLDDKIEEASTEITSSHQTLIEDIINEKKAYNQLIKHALDALDKLQDNLSSPLFKHDSHYLDPGKHVFNLEGKSFQKHITRSHPPISLSIDASLEKSLHALQFPSAPYTAEVSKALFIEKRNDLDVLCKKIQSIKQDHALATHCSFKRAQSEEVQTIQQIREVVKAQLRTHFVKNIDYCYDLLNDIDRQIDTLQKKYRHLQICNRKTFILKAIDTINNSISRNNLERLSDQDKTMFIQFIRCCILRPLKHLLEKTRMIEKGHLTFFASEKEIEMKAAGDNAIKNLHRMIDCQA